MEEEVKEETTEELTAEEIAAAAAETETTETEEVAKEKTWAEYGLDERFNGMSREQIAADILHRNTVYGRQGTELGQAKKDLAAAQEQLNGVKKAADLSVEVKQEVQKMSEGQLARWLEDLQTDPHAAIRGLLGDSYGRRSEDELNELMDKRINEGLEGYHGYTEEQAAMADPDYQSCAGYIKQLQGQEHFGNTRPTMELLEFARLAITNKTAADPLYDVMKRFPGVPMKECIHMINGRPKAEVSANKIRKEVESLAGGGMPSGSKKASETPVIKTMDDAFDVDD